jgi:hypothetical protein
MMPFTESIALLSSDPQTGHIGQRRLHLVAKSMSARSGSSLTGRGFQPKLGSTQDAFDQSFIQNFAAIPAAEPRKPCFQGVGCARDFTPRRTDALPIHEEGAALKRGHLEGDIARAYPL